MNKRVNILGFAGSLRKDSYNKALLHAAKELIPGDARFVIFDLEGIPPFNQVLERKPTEKVRELKSNVMEASIAISNQVSNLKDKNIQ